MFQKYNTNNIAMCMRIKINETILVKSFYHLWLSLKVTQAHKISKYAESTRRSCWM